VSEIWGLRLAHVAISVLGTMDLSSGFSPWEISLKMVTANERVLHVVDRSLGKPRLYLVKQSNCFSSSDSNRRVETRQAAASCRCIPGTHISKSYVFGQPCE